MMDRLVKNFGETEEDYEANLLADMRDLRRYRIPIRAYRIEGWGFPGGNHGLAIHTFTSAAVQAEVIRDAAPPPHPPARLSAPLGRARTRLRSQNGWVATHADGTPYLTTGTAGQRIALIDFTNPAAVRYWKRQVRAIFDLGFDGFMQDFGEEVLFGMRFHDGQTGVTMHNRYLTLYHRATREVIESYQRSHPKRSMWFFTRAGYTGRPGAAAYENANFPGDGTTDWTRSSGLASSTPDMLNRAIGGAYGFGTDIGGYFDLTTPPTTKELFIRWAEWAALSPVFRLHGAGPTGTHAPWTFDAQTVRVYRRLSKLHLRARAADHAAVAPRRGERASRRPARCGSPIPPIAAPAAPIRSGCSAPTCWWRRSSARARPRAGSTSRAGCWKSAGGGKRYRGRSSADWWRRDSTSCRTSSAAARIPCGEAEGTAAQISSEPWSRRRR